MWAILPSQQNQREVELYNKPFGGLLLSSKTVQKNIFIMEGAPGALLTDTRQLRIIPAKSISPSGYSL